MKSAVFITVRGRKNQEKESAPICEMKFVSDELIDGTTNEIDELMRGTEWEPESKS